MKKNLEEEENVKHKKAKIENGRKATVELRFSSQFATDEEIWEQKSNHFVALAV